MASSGGQRPGVVQVEIGKLGGHQLLVGETGAIVLRGVSRDAAGGRHRVANRRGRKVGGARRTLALSEVHAYPKAAVLGVLDGLDIAQSRGDAETGARADARFRGARSEAFSLRPARPGRCPRGDADRPAGRRGLSSDPCTALRAGGRRMLADLPPRPHSAARQHIAPQRPSTVVGFTLDCSTSASAPGLPLTCREPFLPDVLPQGDVPCPSAPDSAAFFAASS